MDLILAGIAKAKHALFWLKKKKNYRLEWLLPNWDCHSNIEKKIGHYLVPVPRAITVGPANRASFFIFAIDSHRSRTSEYMQ